MNCIDFVMKTSIHSHKPEIIPTKDLLKLLQIIIHFCDAPPHGSQFGGGGDAHPNGCPCGLNEHTILSEIKKKNIKLAILNVTSEEALAPMFSIFKQIMPDLISAKATKQDLQEQLLKIIEKEV